MEGFEKKENYKNVGILEADTMNHIMKEKKCIKRYPQRTRKLLDTKFYCRNLIKGIVTGGLSEVKYSEPFFKWTRQKLK